MNSLRKILWDAPHKEVQNKVYPSRKDGMPTAGTKRLVEDIRPLIKNINFPPFEWTIIRELRERKENESYK